MNENNIIDFKKYYEERKKSEISSPEKTIKNLKEDLICFSESTLNEYLELMEHYGFDAEDEIFTIFVEDFKEAMGKVAKIINSFDISE